MITRLEATRYRCFNQLDIDMEHYQVLAGANGSGKSTLLDLPALFGDLLKQRNISSAFLQSQDHRNPRASSLQELVFCKRGWNFSLSLEAKLPEHVVRELLLGLSSTKQADESLWPWGIRYEIGFEIFNEYELQVKNEYAFLFPEKLKPRLGLRMHGEFKGEKEWQFVLDRAPGWPTEFTTETRLGRTKRRKQEVRMEATMLALPRMQFESASEFPATRWLYDLLTSDVVFFNPNWENLRKASPPGQSQSLLSHGLNLPWLALQLKQSDLERYDDWVRHVRIAIPQIQSIDVRIQENDQHAYFLVTYQGGYTVTSSGLSDGTLRAMALTLIAYLEKPPRLIVAEEPENGIHPRAIEAVLDALSSLYDSQMWVSSHSPIVLAHTPLEQVVCARVSKEPGVEMIRGDQHPRMIDWKGSLDLGTLFAAGVLG